MFNDIVSNLLLTLGKSGVAFVSFQWNKSAVSEFGEMLLIFEIDTQTHTPMLLLIPLQNTNARGCYRVVCYCPIHLVFVLIQNGL